MKVDEVALTNCSVPDHLKSNLVIYYSQNSSIMQMFRADTHDQAGSHFSQLYCQRALKKGAPWVMDVMINNRDTNTTRAMSPKFDHTFFTDSLKMDGVTKITCKD
jgi:hypothetical protein